MALTRGICILVDTNIIIEATRCGVWGQLSKEFRLGTVETCVTETQTGHQRRRPEQTIDHTMLQATLSNIAVVSDLERAALILKCEDARNIDDGERDLCAHALVRNPGDTWFVASSDKAAVRVAFLLGWKDRLISLGEMIDLIGAKPTTSLKGHFTKAWLESVRTALVLNTL